MDIPSSHDRTSRDRQQSPTYIVVPYVVQASTSTFDQPLPPPPPVLLNDQPLQLTRPQITTKHKQDTLHRATPYKPPQSPPIDYNSASGYKLFESSQDQDPQKLNSQNAKFIPVPSHQKTKRRQKRSNLKQQRDQRAMLDSSTTSDSMGSPVATTTTTTSTAPLSTAVPKNVTTIAVDDVAETPSTVSAKSDSPRSVTDNTRSLGRPYQQSQNYNYNPHPQYQQHPMTYAPNGALVPVHGAMMAAGYGQIPWHAQYLPQMTKMNQENEKTSSNLGLPESKTRLILLLLVLMIIIGVLVAMAVAVISQVTTHNKRGMRLVRQYEGRMLVLDGEMLNVDSDVLDAGSTAYADTALQFTNVLDQTYSSSHIASIYEGAEITRFRIVPELPALEVQFAIKTSVESKVDAAGLVRILHDGIKGRLSPEHAVIDMRSITIEDQRVEQK